MPAFLEDLLFSIRTLRKSPGFALTAILTLALGIGAVTSVFSVVQSVLLKPFAFPHPERLVMLREKVRSLDSVPLPVNYRHFLNWEANSKTIEDAAIFRNGGFSVSAGTDHPEIVKGLWVSPDFFSVLGVGPVLGRGFAQEDVVDGHNRVAILSWSAWQRYFQGSPDAIGKTLRVGGEPQVVIGVLPRDFSFPRLYEMPESKQFGRIRPYEIFQPLVVDRGHLRNDGSYNYLAIGRLTETASYLQAQSELTGIQKNFGLAVHANQQPSVLVSSLTQEVSGGVSTALWLLLAAVATVLLIACANLANLQLARAVTREQELAVRAALGANKRQIVRSVLMDSLLLSVVGGSLGILLSFAGVKAFLALAPGTLPRLNDVGVSWPVLAAASALTLLTALGFGLFPAIRSARVEPHAAIQSHSTRLVSSKEGRRTRQVLVAGEVAFTLALLVVTLLLGRSFSRLLNQDRDFDSRHLTLAEVNLYSPKYGDDMAKSTEARAAFLDRAMENLSQLPGVESVAVTSEMPMGGDTWVDGVFRPDHPIPPGQEPHANIRWVSPSYASTLRIPLLSGRDLQEKDKQQNRNVALISQQTANSIWPGLDPIGRKFHLGDPASDLTVVGVVADARINALKKTANMIYLPYWSNPLWREYFLIRTPKPTAAVADSLRKTLWAVDSDIAIPTLKSLDEQIDDSVATERFQTLLLTSFGCAALLLALLGIYGVLAYSVSLREREFGIRMALGCEKTALMQLVARQAALPIGGGVLMGLVMALVATRWIQSLLYQTKAVDGVTLISSLALLLTAALLAAIVPAWRASTVDPAEVLRND